ncbi:inner membrane protein [Nitrosomonas ureae]|uniref:metal-dependent hydrolase n=1 Tax=Nitrosomonas ureae TaxID=44577 RepID=UPI000D76A386|nr:metal-dependent hydrolase [Nitrosomonas ureae]PXX11641.1 inner membrane protein [Nitrosomonas ureae]
MDPLTHALSGALLARAVAQSPPPSRPKDITVLPLHIQIAAGFTAAAFPDVDFALRLIDTLTYLNWHQGPTHSLILLPLWAWLLSRLFAWLTQRHGAWKLFFPPICLGIASHIAGDFITSYGLMLFAPFSTERFSLPLVFVIDPWFSLIIIVGLIISWRYPRQRIAAMAALACLCGYVIILWTLYQQAIEIGVRYTDSQAISQAHITALPQPLSPFHWKIIIRHNETYHLADMNLQQSLGQHRTTSLLSKMASAYRPISENNWHVQQQFGDDFTQRTLVREAWLSPVFEPFRTFAQFPVLERIDTLESDLCIWFYDLRFQFPELPPSFRYGACRKGKLSDWKIVRRHGLFYID